MVLPLRRADAVLWEAGVFTCGQDNKGLYLWNQMSSTNLLVKACPFLYSLNCHAQLLCGCSARQSQGMQGACLSCCTDQTPCLVHHRHVSGLAIKMISTIKI